MVRLLVVGMVVDDVFGLVGTEVVGGFQVDGVVAEGGFAVVYRALHKGFNAAVALKCLKIPQHMSEVMRERFRLQFQDEAELLFKLSASIPNVVRPLHVDAITAPNGQFMPFMALEWLDGETLENYARKHGHRAGEAAWLIELVELMTPAAQALAFAHKFPGPEGPVAIVHRDIKPANLYVATVAQKPMVKILDFGIGKARSVASQVAGKQSTQQSGINSFTPAYGAPEQWVPRRLGQTGPWTDVWGLALTLVELFLGRPALGGDQAAVVGAALDAECRPTPRNQGAEVTDAVEAVFKRALAVDPRDRYQDAGAFWKALRIALGLKVSRPPVERATSREGVRAQDALDFGEVANSELALELESIPPRRGPAAQLIESFPSRTAGPAVAAGGASNGTLGMGSAEVAVALGGAPHWATACESALSSPSVEAVRELPALTIHASPVGGFGVYLVPGTAIASGIVLSLLGQHYAATLGQVFSIGPVGLSWVTIPMVLGGCLAIVYRLVRQRPSRL